MGKHLHLDCFSGIAGDMLLGALVELGADPRKIEEALRSIELGEWSIQFSREDAGHAMHGTSVRVIDADHVQGQPSHSDHDHHHSHDHSHRHYADILKTLEAANLSQRALSMAKAIFDPIARAEAKVHNTTVDVVAFHEVGAVDSIVDIAGCAVALDLLDITSVSASPIPLGHGFTKSQHGRIPVPAPATLECLAGVPCYDSGLTVELVTPTGAGIIAGLVGQFTHFPTMVVERIGYGAGTRKHDDRPNLLRAILGQRNVALGEEEVWELSANIDDQTSEELAYAASVIREAGALDCWITPITMKKGRQAVCLSVLCHAADRENLIRLVLRETTSLGVRIARRTRCVLTREFVQVETPYGPISIKLGRGEDGSVWNVAVEAADCERAATTHGVALKQVRAAATSAAAHLFESSGPKP